MDLRINAMVFVLGVVFAMFAQACRPADPEETVSWTDHDWKAWHNIVGDAGMANDPSPDAAPDTVRDRPKLVRESSPVTLPTGTVPDPAPEMKGYATDVLLNAGCEMNPLSMAVAKGHTMPALCEHIVGIAAQNQDGDFNQIGAKFNWGVTDPTVVDVPCRNMPNTGFCFGVGKQDIFDVGGSTEPSTDVIACALNTCPDPRPSDCSDMVCNVVTVASVINLEGAWFMAGPDLNLNPGTVVHLTQDGRSFVDPQVGVKQGNITGTAVSFKIDDVLYTGEISWDRDFISGEVVDQLSSTSLGSWSAERMP